uniref:Uncharacterized protein n=1 Tax=Romanomermis culicivorax TaxID=13658 RepID=A0A915K9I2_ROMCU
MMRNPALTGEHYIDVRLYGQSVADSPFSCNVGDPDLVTVRNMPAKIRHDELGEPHTFEIDATVAGSGNLEIMINGGRIHCSVREIGSRLYLATFTPTQPVTHVVEMKFNGEPVKHSPWRIEVILPSESSESKTTTTTSTGAFTLPGMGNVILAPINLAQLQSGMYPGYVPNFYPQSSSGGAMTTTI